MKEDIALQLICRNILERHNEAPSGEELDAFLEAGVAADLLSAFSDGLMHNWHTWKKEWQAGGQEGGQEKQATDDAASKADVALKNDITSDAGWANSEDEEIMAGFLETEEAEEIEGADASPQDNFNEEKDAAAAELSADLEENEEESEEERNSAQSVASESDNADSPAENPDDANPVPTPAEAPLPSTDQSCTTPATPSQAEPTECPPAPKNAEAQPPTADPDVHLPSQSPTMNREPYSSTVLLKIPNAMVNTAYSEQLTVASGEVIRITTVEGLADTGLCYDDETQSVQGNPANPGEFKLTVTYTVQSGGSGQGQLNFVV
ncbi:MAG: hypothetical protein D3903_22090, partial [Candidatus Electrothrix sp. GM3_4]|nr:hypothetical protein [Candidatus Electrothrix sp. GM3_4]